MLHYHRNLERDKSVKVTLNDYPFGADIWLAHDIWFLSGQVVYEDEDDETMSLVVVARSGDKRQAWVQAIRCLLYTSDAADES